MAHPEQPSKSSDKSSRSRFVSWMKRIAKPKASSKKRNTTASPEKANRVPVSQEQANNTSNGDQPLAPQLSAPQISTPSSRPSPQANDSFHSFAQDDDPAMTPQEDQRPTSTSPTLETNNGMTHSDGVLSEVDRHSKAGTSGTMTGGVSTVSGGGAPSIFTSSNHSSRSLTTTLTTIQSAPSNTNANHVQLPNGTGQAQTNSNGNSTHHSTQPSQSSTYFQHQYPTTPASAVPPHLNPTMHVPTTYRSATADNLLTDNASVLTLASSSGRPNRRNSLDTNASIRAIAPSSTWGASRESLPLSTFSHQADAPPTAASATPPSTAGAHLGSHRSVSGLTRDERASVYSSGTGGGVGAPVLSSERNSIYAGKTPGDAASVHDRMSLKAGSIRDERFDGTASSMRSGHVSHGRNDSMTGSIGGLSSPLASTKDGHTVDGSL